MTTDSETLVARTARALGRMSLDHDEGAFLGAEDDLLKHLAVSRPTLRQAAKIAETDRMIEVRRGIRGGYYAARPDADDAIRMLARFLRLRGTTLTQIMDVARLVSERAAALAAICHDEALREQLREFLGRIDGHDSRASMIAAENELARTIAAMSGNPAIELVMAIGYSFGMEEEDSPLFRDSHERQAMRVLQRNLVTAILDRDPEIAVLMMRRRRAAMAGWLGQSGSD